MTRFHFVLCLAVLSQFVWAGRLRDRFKSRVEVDTESSGDAENVDGLATIDDIESRPDEGADAESSCTGDEADLTPSEQNKVDKFLQWIQGRFVARVGVWWLRRSLKNPDSNLRKLLGRAAQDPTDEEFEEGNAEPEEAINGQVLKVIMKLLGETRTVVGYLWYYGFLPKILNKSPIASENYNGTIPPCAITNAIKEFQRWNQIEPADGILTKETRELMAKERCGNPDVECDTPECIAEMEAADPGTHLRRRRYIVKSKTWGKDEEEKVVLKYYFENYLERTDEQIADGYEVLDKDRVRRQVELGLESWVKYANINFVETEDPDESDIQLKFGRYDHGDKAPFDGPWGVLAHMYYPRSGQMHFDSSENFTDSQQGPGVNLFYTTAHEMGHGLGIKHSEDRYSLMAPYYAGYRDPMLNQDDIDAIKYQYGEGIGSVTPIGSDTGPEEDHCIATFSAGLSDPFEMYRYLFTGTQYVRLEPRDKDDKGVGRLPMVTPGYPFEIADKWPGLSGPFDAAFTDKKTDRSYFFKENKVWTWDWVSNSVNGFNGEPIENTIFKDIPSGITAVAGYRDFYIFFTDTKYYLFNMDTGIVDPAGHPSPFSGATPTETVSSAYKSFFNGYMYFSSSERKATYVLLRSRNLSRDGAGAQSLEEAQEAFMKNWKYKLYKDDFVMEGDEGFKFCT